MIDPNKTYSTGEMLRITGEMIRTCVDNEFLFENANELIKQPKLPIQWLHIGYTVGSTTGTEESENLFRTFMEDMMAFATENNIDPNKLGYPALESFTMAVEYSETLDEVIERFKKIDLSDMVLEHLVEELVVFLNVKQGGLVSEPELREEPKVQELHDEPEFA